MKLIQVEIIYRIISKFEMKGVSIIEDEKNAEKKFSAFFY